MIRTVKVKVWPTLLASLARTHLLLAGNDTVPISVWRGGGMCTRVPSA